MCSTFKPFVVAQPLVWAQQYCSGDAGPLISFVRCVWQDAKVVLADVRELKFALEESNEAAEHLQSELAAAQVISHVVGISGTLIGNQSHRNTEKTESG